MCVISIAILLNTIFLFLPITAHSRGPCPPLAGPVPGSRFSFVMQRPMRPRARHRFSAHTVLIIPSIPCHNKVYFTRKSLFPHILLVFNRFVTVPFQTFYADFTLVISNHVTRPAPPSPHARYRPKRGTPAAGVHLHMAAHITHLKILHRVPSCFVLSGACLHRRFPLPVAPCGCIIAHAASHKSDFQGFSGIFKKCSTLPKWEGGALQIRLFSGAQWAAAYSGTTRPGCGAFSSRDFS